MSIRPEKLVHNGARTRHKPVSMQAYKLISAQCGRHLIYMRHIFLNVNNIETFGPGSFFQVGLDGGIFAIIHHNVDDRMQTLQQMTGQFIIAHMRTDNDTTLSSIHHFVEVMATIPAYIEAIFLSAEYIKLVQQALSEDENIFSEKLTTLRLGVAQPLTIKGHYGDTRGRNKKYIVPCYYFE